MENVIKSITKAPCPHCKKEFFVEFEMPPTSLSQIYTQEQVDDSKALVLKEINRAVVDDVRKENLTNWVTDPTTVFGPGEVPLIIKSLEENKETPN